MSDVESHAAHDAADHAAGLRHSLTPINILTPSGTMATNCGEFAGMPRFDARDAILAALEVCLSCRILSYIVFHGVP